MFLRVGKIMIRKIEWGYKFALPNKNYCPYNLVKVNPCSFYVYETIIVFLIWLSRIKKCVLISKFL
jgi:hypothetical protein